MGARWMQQKLAKMRKMRKAYLKPYRLHMVNRRPPNKDVIKEYKERALNIGVDTAYIDELFRVKHKNGAPRMAALLTKQQLEQVVEVEKYIVVWDRPGIDRLILFTGKKIFFQQTDFRLNRRRSSLDYYTPNAARSAYQNHAIKWCEWVQLPPPN